MVAAAIKAPVLGIGLSTTVRMKVLGTTVTEVAGLHKRNAKAFHAGLETFGACGRKVESWSLREGLAIMADNKSGRLGEIGLTKLANAIGWLIVTLGGKLQCSGGGRSWRRHGRCQA